MRIAMTKLKLLMKLKVMKNGRLIKEYMEEVVKRLL